jgi:hypothetical protein
MYTNELWWCMLEVAIGLIAACLPTLRGLIKMNSADSVLKNVRSYFSLGSSSSTSKLALTKDSRDSKEKSEGSLDATYFSQPTLKTSSTEERRVAPWV